VHTCKGQLPDMEPSLIATAFALSAYTKVKKDGAEEIASWLLFKYSEDTYKSFFEAKEVANALDSFADYSESINGEHPVIFTKCFEYVCPIENITGDNDFTVLNLKS